MSYLRWIGVPALAALVIAWLLTGQTRNEWIAFAACMAAASAVYLLARARRLPLDLKST